MMAALGEEDGGEGDAPAVHPTVKSTAGLLGQIATQLVAGQVRKDVIVLCLALQAVVDPAMLIITLTIEDATDLAAESSKLYRANRC